MEIIKLNINNEKVKELKTHMETISKESDLAAQSLAIISEIQEAIDNGNDSVLVNHELINQRKTLIESLINMANASELAGEIFGKNNNVNKQGGLLGRIIRILKR